MAPIVYLTLMIITCGYALLRGRFEERFIAIICVGASITSSMALSPVSQRYASVETGELIIDLAVLGLFVGLALRSPRFWPLWVAGLQLTTSLSHFLKAVNIDLMPAAYAAAERFWSYPILIVLAVATWRSRHHYRVTTPPSAMAG